MTPSSPSGSAPELVARRPPLRALMRGNVGGLSGTSFLNDVSSEMIFPLLPLFLVQLGAGPAFLGLIEGIAETTASTLKLFGGWISDRLGRRKPLAVWGYAIAACARPLVAVATAPWHVLAVRFTDRVGKGIRSAPRDALLAESVAPDQRGAAFGLHRAADHAGAVLGPLVAAALLWWLPERLRLVFALAALPGLAAVLLLVFLVREVAVTKPPRDAPELTLRDLGPAFPRYLGVVVLFTLGNASDAFLLLRAQELGVAVAMIPLLWAVLHVSKVLWSVPGGMAADRAGPGWVIVGGWVVYALVYLGFALATREWHVWVLFAVYGLFYGMTEAPEKALVAALAPPELRGRAFGSYHFAIGIAALPASLLFGLIWEAASSRAAFATGAVIAVIAALLLPLTFARRA